MTATMLRQIERLATRFFKDQRGVAAVEFIMVAPLLLVLMFGTVQFTNAYAVQRKLTQVAHTMSDLISQASKAGSCDTSNAFAVALAIMSPYSTASLKGTISEVYIDPTTKKATVVWSQGRGKNGYQQGDVVTLPAGIALSGKYLIMSEVSYDYQPLVGFDGNAGFISPVFSMSKQTFSGPRQSADVAWDPSAATCAVP